MAYTKYSLTPANNNAAPPDGAPEGMLPSAVNDTMRDMMAQIRDVGDGIRGGTYTMTAPVITGGSITGVALSGNTFTNPVITGGSINNTPIGASTANTGAFTTLSATGATTLSGTTVVSGSLTANTFSSSGATITGGSINSTAIGGTTAAAGKFTTLEATGVTTVQAGTVSAPAITTTGDTNTGIFFPAADTIAFTKGGVESMRIDSSGNVGIGTSSPATAFYKLTVAGDAGSGAGVLIRSDSGTSNVFGRIAFTRDGTDGTTALIRNSNADYSLQFWTANGTSNAERMRIDSSGNVCVGTATAIYTNTNRGNITINGASQSILSFGIGGSGKAYIYHDDSAFDVWNVDSSPLRFATADTERMRITSGGIVLAGTTTAPSGGSMQMVLSNSLGAGLQLNNSTGVNGGAITSTGGNGLVFFGYSGAVGSESYTERMRIDSSGNIGIGTSSPSSRLHVNAASGSVFTQISSGTNDMYLGYDTTTGMQTVQSDTGLLFATGASFTERMRIDSSGNLLVGTTSTGLTNSRSFTYQGTGDGSFYVNHSTANTSGDPYLRFGYNGTQIGSITQNGTTGVLYNTSSDYRLKTITGNLTGYKERIMALQPKQGTWNTDGSEFKGFIAHEFAEQYPNAVSGKKDAVDKDGKPVYQGMQAGGSETIADLVALAQEQQAMIETLQAEVALLKSK